MCQGCDLGKLRALARRALNGKSPRKRGLDGEMKLRRNYFASLRITVVALVPPKPKLLDITVVSSR